MLYEVITMYALAAAQADQAEFLRGAHIIIDGLDSFSPAVLLLLEKVMGLAVDTVAAFRDAGDGSDAEIFASERRDMQRFISAAQRSGETVALVSESGLAVRHESRAMAFLEANLYSYPYKPYQDEPEGIRIVEAQTLEQEVKSLAAGILGEIKRGKRFRDIAVAGGNLSAYLPAIKSRNNFV